MHKTASETHKVHTRGTKGKIHIHKTDKQLTPCLVMQYISIHLQQARGKSWVTQDQDRKQRRQTSRQDQAAMYGC